MDKPIVRVSLAQERILVKRRFVQAMRTGCLSEAEVLKSYYKKSLANVSA